MAKAEKRKRRASGKALNSATHVAALARGLKFLSLFSSECRSIRLMEAARAIDATPSATYRVAMTLCGMGVLNHDLGANTYAVNLNSLGLGYSALCALDVSEIARPVLEDVHSRLKVAVQLTVIRGGECVHILNLPRPELMPLHSSHHPVALTAAVRMWLSTLSPAQRLEFLKHPALRALHTSAWLERECELTTQRGYGKSDGEELAGVCSIGTPIWGAQKHFLAALTVMVPKWIYPNAALESDIIPCAREAAADISERLRLRVDDGNPQPS